MTVAFTILTFSVFAQDSTKQKTKMAKQKMEKVNYNCPMHPNVTSNKPDKCITCGMPLEKSKKKKMDMGHMNSHSCPMHPDVKSDKAGTCSKCGMELTKSKKEQMGDKKMYTCPMHSDVTSDKPGKCSKCGMDLKEKENIAVVYACPMKCEGDKTYDKAGKCPVCNMNLKEKKDEHAGHKH